MNEDLFRRRWLLISLTFIVVVTFVARLAFLQLLSGDYKQRAENNAYYILSTIPSRGVIYDRNGALLVANRPIYDLMIVNKDVKGKLDTTLLAEILRIPREDIVARLRLLRDRTVNRGYSPYTPQVLVSQLETEDVGRFQEQLYKFSGLSIRSRTIRQYDYHHAAHLLGYLSEASPSDLERDSTIIRGDFVGRSGVERTYEEALRGVKGQEIFYRDSRGRIQGRLDGGAHDRAPIKGKDITLSIDSGLQALGERLMRGKRGAIVAIEPSTGEVLALVTAPGYDPALLSGRNKGLNHRALEETFGKPLLNRAIQGNYPPGSTFKPVVLSQWINSGRGVNAQIDGTALSYPSNFGWNARCVEGGKYYYRDSANGWSFKNAVQGYQSWGTVAYGIRVSANSYLYSMVSKLDLCDISDMANKLHLHDGLGQQLYDPGLLSANIGGTRYGATPLTMASAYATFASEGKYCEPRPLEKITKSDGSPMKTYESKCEQAISPDIANGVSYVLKGVLAPGGSAPKRAIGLPDASAAKTGTNDNSSQTWMVGYTRGLATASWVGSNDLGYRSMNGIAINGRVLEYVDGATYAGAQWQQFMQAMAPKYNTEKFTEPPASVTSTNVNGN